MNIEGIESVVQTALKAAGFVNVLTQDHVTDSPEQVTDLYFDKSQDPPRVDYLVVRVSREGSDRFASHQVLEFGRVDVDVYLQKNEQANTEAEMRQHVDDVCDALDELLTYSGEVDRTFPPVASSIFETDVKTDKCWKALVSQRFEVPKQVTYS